jgi:HSP20 family molecular chaperone IbpA
VSRVQGLNNPLVLGFEQALVRFAGAGGDGYPPYNVEQIGETRLRITLAVAGFDAADLGVSVEGDQLVVTGRHQATDERVYLHRSIAARSFKRSFVLASGLEVTGARLDNGLLAIDLARPIRGVTVKTIAIGAGPFGAGDRSADATASGRSDSEPR